MAPNRYGYDLSTSHVTTAGLVNVKLADQQDMPAVHNRWLLCNVTG